MSDQHWSRARADRNAAAIEYYRQRSRAPGIAEGGAPRNFYCMRCDGVIPFDTPRKDCPHCKAALDERVVRCFNWVEINEPPASDVRALLVPVAAAAVILLATAVLVYLWWSRA
jgi:hypothetical protein